MRILRSTERFGFALIHMVNSRTFLVPFVLYLVSPSRAEGNIGSTSHLKDIVFGRCWDFQLQKVNEVKPKNCSTIWGKFHQGFAYKDPCNLTSADYKPYFDEIGMDVVNPNKSLFWSGTYKEAHLFSDFSARFTTLEDTMAGWMVNGLTWCGSMSNTSDGISTSSCPSCDFATAFWGEASSRFAAKASGVVRVMLNGTRVNNSGYPIPAYRNESYFGQFELPHMRPKAITKLLILVVHSIGETELESCANGSIKLLQDDAKHRGITTACYDDPNDVEHLLCTDHPTSRECVFFKNIARNDTQPVPDCKPWKILAILMMASLAVSLIGTVIWVIIFKRRAFSSVNYQRHSI